MALNNRMKEVQKAALNDEKRTIQLLQRIYEQAAKDTEAKFAALNARTDLQNIQSFVYQKQYQEALKKQLDGIINDLHTQSFTTISEYLGKSYEHGFYGTLYDLHGQGVPFLFPIRQYEVVKALNNDYSNIAKTQRGKDIYKRMGENTDYLKKAVRAEVSRGIANGSSWLDIASHVAKGMNSPFNRAMKRAFLITRTEGHRVQNQATVDVQKRAKALGADIVKQWDATLDANTRPWHAEADGQIREIDEEFDVGGEKMKAPGIGGSARNVCNCRCVLLQRAKWALGEAELKTLQDRASFFGLDKSKSFDDFKRKYLKLPDDADKLEVPDVSRCHYGTTKDYSRLTKVHTKTVSKGDAAQIAKHTKSDGSPGGYVATHNYTNINSNMRGDGYAGNKLDADDLKTIDSMRKAISQCTTDDDYIVTRYVNADYLSKVFGIMDSKGRVLGSSDIDSVHWGGRRVKEFRAATLKTLKDATGTILTEDAFMSTSFLRDKNIMSDKPVRMSINVAKGTHCYIPKNKKESECIFADKSRLLLTDAIDSIDGKIELVFTLIEG